ncbi:MAG: 3'(2'),5'-bisphosphate nucleotidase CysQ [Acidimicrobiales bacterium]
MISDHEVALDVAEGAGRFLLRVRAEFRSAAPEVLRAEGDRCSHRWITGALRLARPHDVVLSEEGDLTDLARLDAARVWIVDPLDGTREFGEPGRGDWAVHVALWEGRGLTAGAVTLPAADLSFSTAHPPLLPPRVASTGLRLVASRTRRSSVVEDVAARLGAEVVPMGSAGAKAMAVVRGTADLYAHAGGLREWDVAAPAAVAAAAGLHVSRLDGSPMFFNGRSGWVGDLLICRPELASRALGL